MYKFLGVKLFICKTCIYKSWVHGNYKITLDIFIYKAKRML